MQTNEKQLETMRDRRAEITQGTGTEIETRNETDNDMTR